MNNYESYPPPFRPKSGLVAGVDGGDAAGSYCQDSDDPLPAIDLQAVGSEEEKRRLAGACREWGVFRLVNHGIPVRLLSQLLRQAEELFWLPFESKRALFRGGGGGGGGGSPVMAYFWGNPALSPSGMTLQRGPNALNVNWVEGFNVALSQLSDLRAQDPALDSFRLLLEEYGRHQARVATTIFKAIAESLELGKEQRKRYLSPPTGFLRVYRYPRCPDADGNWGMDVHTDSSVISVLSHDEVGGLQVQKDERWLDVKPIPGTLLVNLGDMMQAMSNDEYKSVKHRVKANKRAERISIGYFVFPAEGGVIQSSNYKPFTYDEFRAQVQHDLQTVGFKVGLDRFKLSEPS
ncbi:gibberellin 2-beta-dioxygenase 6-like [Diospyros lotus]|uniref:gibberellin 2-beta-dioxygenase 6-like n=1 Tax=Diospyros lotus TaxID=55363 RepID=UPI00225112EF|nr:gibberellin 2-beta-dioxygenase 6-like [Diospyros lotus]